jgi:hypothetical protein
MRYLRSTLTAGFLLAASLAMPARGDTQPRGNAVPGTLNYVEGQVSLDSQPLNSKSIGETILEPGQSITTENGKAEVLLTPGVFLRVGSNSAVKMISPSLTNTEIGVEEGEASVEVAEIHKQNDIRIDADGATTELLKNGYYDFDAAHNQVRVLDGEAIVDDDGRQVKVKSGHALALNQESGGKPQSFDKKAYEATALGGTARVGIGTPGLALTRSFRATESSTVRSVGDSTRRSMRSTLRSLRTDITLTASIMTSEVGVLAHITLRAFVEAAFVPVTDMSRRAAESQATVSVAVEEFIVTGSRVAEEASMEAVVDLEAAVTAGKSGQLE